MKRKLICPICGKEFVTDKNAKRYCSVKCRKKANSKPKPMTVKKLKCDWCGEEFLSERRKKYCCKDCRLYANGRLKKREPKPKKVLSIEEVAVLSREAGMSYGEYVRKYNI
jgi:hypothetical protein